jgi:hypothetical protein
MIIVGAPESIYTRGASKPRSRVELLNASSSLNGRSPRESRVPMVNRELRTDSGACYSETRGEHVLIEPGPSSTFVAQILGQELVTKRPDPDARGRAYARAADATPAPRLLRFA